MSINYLLDASALLAMLQDEPGAGVVAGNLSFSAISAVNLAEVASVLNKLGMEESDIQQLFDGLDLPVVTYNADAAIATGAIRKKTSGKGLSLGDRACLMTAKQHKYTVVTADKVWLEYQQLLAVDMQVIR
uniref:PIN domain-containing protein n=1 Tax=uncultured Thiotrichaceae bacterium TaxID=298394 RepID=A0A6S6TEH6_9GAMM|nr:MAG: Unknown protein [uncultured Thiotrichaceae bacterium]